MIYRLTILVENSVERESNLVAELSVGIFGRKNFPMTRKTINIFPRAADLQSRT